MSHKFTVVLFCIVLLTQFAFGQVPEKISYQGVLTDAGGVPVPNGNYNLKFAIYNVASGGTALWTENQSVQVTNGLFNVNLGEVASLTLPFNEPYWLGVTVGTGTELTPRVELTAAGYSLNANSVVDNAVTTPKIADGAVTQAKLDPGITLPPGGTAGGDLSGTYPNPTVTALQTRSVAATAPISGQVLKWDGSSWAPGTDNAGTSVWAPSGNNIYNTNSGNVGVGTSTPSFRFEVQDNLASNINPLMELERTGSNSATPLRFRNGSGDLYNIGITSSSKFAISGMNSNLGLASDIFTVSSSGNVGIGTTNPTERLYMVGNSYEKVILESTSSSGFAEIRSKTTGGVNDYLTLYKGGPSTSGTTAGIPLANLSRVAAGAQAGALMLQVITNNPMYFVTNNIERMRITSNGFIGIRTNPTADIELVQSDGTSSGTGGMRFTISGGSNWKILHTGAHFSFAENGTRLAYIESGTGNYVQPSDLNLKKNIETIEGTLDRVLRLNPVKFNYINQNNSATKIPGLIAQEVEQIFPELVRTDEEGEKGLAYDNFIVLVIKAIQEQQQIIEELQKEIQELKAGK